MNATTQASQNLFLQVMATGTQVHAEHEAHYDYEEHIRHHIIDMRLLDINMAASYQVNSWLGLELGAPFRVVQVDATYLDENEQPLGPDRESDIHHRDEVLYGLADLQLLGTTQIPSLVEPFNTHLGIRAGISLPIAETQPNPFELGLAEKKHQHIFFGTGTVDPILGLSFRTVFSDFDLIGWTQAKSSLWENEHGYRGSTIVSGALGLKSGFGLDSLQFVIQQEIQHETPATWRNSENKVEDARNSGRTELLASLGAFWNPNPQFSAYALAKIPYYRNVKGKGEMDIPGYLSIGVQYQIPLAQSTDEPEHVHEMGMDMSDHNHDTEMAPTTAPQPAYTGPGDIKDLATGGASFDLAKAAVPGKITVLDFWAEWCEPCHLIDGLLREVAEHDGNIAVRRIEVPDFDGPVYHEHLHGVPGLPVVWILDANGKMIEKMAGVSPEVVAEKLNALLQCDTPHSPPAHEHSTGWFNLDKASHK